jgi:hypothetical protein
MRAVSGGAPATNRRHLSQSMPDWAIVLGAMLVQRAVEILAAGPASGPPATLAWILRLASGAVFLVFGLGKFTDHR